MDHSENNNPLLDENVIDNQFPDQIKNVNSENEKKNNEIQESEKPKRKNNSVSSIDQAHKKKDSFSERKLKGILDDKERGIGNFDYLAKIHSESLIVNGKYSKCDCCKYVIPKSSFSVFENHPSSSYYKYGIDCVNYFLFIDFYITLIYIIFISFLMEFLIALMIKNFYLPGGGKFDILLIEYYFQRTLYEENVIIKLLFTFFRLIIIVILISRLRNKLKKEYKEYRKNLSKFYIDESIYSIFVKNLPILTDIDEFINHIETTHKVKIKRVIFLKEAERYSELKNTLKELRNRKANTHISTEDKEVDNLIHTAEEELKENLSKAEFSQTAILIFDKNEDKNLFLRTYFKKTDFGCQKINKFRNKQYYVEPVPQLNMISWGNIGVSVGKDLAKSKTQMVFTFIFFSLLTSILFGIQMFLTTIDNTIFGVKILFSSSIIMFIINLIVEFSFSILIPTLRSQTPYFDQCCTRLYVMHKTFLVSVIIKIIKYNYHTSYIYEDNVDFLIFLLLLALKSFIFIFYPPRQAWKHTKFYFNKWFRKQKLDQANLNQVYEEPEIDLMLQHDRFRTICLVSLFVIKLYPLVGLLLIIISILYKFFLKWVMFNKRSFKSIMYYGYYFNMFAKMEMMNLLFISLALMSSDFLSGNTSTIIMIGVLDINFLFRFYFSYNPNYIEQNHSEFENKFAFKFDDLEEIKDLRIRIMSNLSNIEKNEYQNM